MIRLAPTEKRGGAGERPHSESLERSAMGSWVSASASARASPILPITMHIDYVQLLVDHARAWRSPPGLGGNPPCAQSVELVVEG
eukprot:4969160-Pyramimonas_sp.AAC.1